MCLWSLVQTLKYVFSSGQSDWSLNFCMNFDHGVVKVYDFEDFSFVKTRQKLCRNLKWKNLMTTFFDFGNETMRYDSLSVHFLQVFCAWCKQAASLHFEQMYLVWVTLSCGPLWQYFLFWPEQRLNGTKVELSHFLSDLSKPEDSGER